MTGKDFKPLPNNLNMTLKKAYKLNLNKRLFYKKKKLNKKQ